ncbi:hypothetical protein F3Y22_tig00110387pilonHSYRG00016 [Hibiscus syriacus]|uniref:Uncharacterized protein n=1 Tax=Hibiscus syriacus TaxID=106335 RepID=A0A6A3AVF4_HIBSY|nr:hypothetical protein F3Y22_tig00110387pilonHSYRG00016 [Hibiscus syriacus]
MFSASGDGQGSKGKWSMAFIAIDGVALEPVSNGDPSWLRCRRGATGGRGGITWSLGYHNPRVSCWRALDSWILPDPTAEIKAAGMKMQETLEFRGVKVHPCTPAVHPYTPAVHPCTCTSASMHHAVHPCTQTPNAVSASMHPAVHLCTKAATASNS